MSQPKATGKALPTGIVTFLFTDIEGSTRLLSQLGDDYQPLLEQHALILRGAIEGHSGVEVNTEGDAFFAVFASPAAAIAAAAAAQAELAAHEWPAGSVVRIRMGVHSGEGKLGGDDYIGMDVHRAARIASAAHGGQVIVSDATRGLLGASSDSVELRDLGAHQLKDLDAPERLYQLVIPDLPNDFPPPRAQRRGNVPEPATSFIGRDDVVAEIESLLQDSRLVTVTGPGGVGKTRLALQVASDFAGRLADGAFFVPLDTLREPDLLPTAIASVMEINTGEEDPLAALKSHLATLDVLLVLDNFEQIPGAAGIVDELMQSAPGSRVLATSQSPLGLYGENEYPAPPLSVPNPAKPPALDKMLEFESVALFVARARAAKPQFRIDERNAQAIIELTARLDGLPLAIELAAARIKLLTPQAILDRLESRLDLLSSSAKNIPERQRTLRGAIDWSYGLLSLPEQHFFDRIGVFAGGFEFEAAEQLVNPENECGMDPFDALASLVEKSLLRQVELDDQPRFSQLESIRQYALEHLGQRDESDLMHRRLAEYIASQAEAAERYLDRADDQGWFARLVADQDNIRAALRWAVASKEAELAERIVGPGWRFWMRQGLLSEGSWWTDETLAIGAEPSATRAKALIAQGSLAYWRLDYDAAGVAYEAALDTYVALGDAAGETNAAYNLGYAHYMKSEPDWDGARTTFRTALDGFRSAGDAPMTQSTLFIIGWIEAYLGDIEDAERYFLEAYEMDAGDVRPLTGLATVSFNRGDYAQARAYMHESIEQTREMHDVAFRIVQLETMVPIEVSDGNVELGMMLKGAAQALREEIGGGPPVDRSIRVDPVELAREAIGDRAVEQAVSEGRSLGADKVIAAAMAGETPAR